MAEWLIVLIALLIYPLLGFLIVLFTRRRKELRKQLLIACAVVNAVAIFGLVTTVSTTVVALDWLILTSLYLSVCIGLWIGVYTRHSFLQLLFNLLSVFTFGFSYISGTIGALGIGMAMDQYVPRNEEWLGSGVIYKETPLGNALTKYRATQIEIYSTIPWLPVLEWRVQRKVYKDFILIMSPPKAVYDAPHNKVYLYASQWDAQEQKTVTWADTLSAR